MKSLTLLRFAAILLALSWATFATISCQKEGLPAPQPDPDPIDTSTVDGPDLHTDLIGYLQPLEQVLFYTPGYLEQALALLGAQQTGPGSFFMQGVSPSGKIVPISFTAVELEAPQMADILISDDKILLPDLVTTFEERGTRYRLFKNAKCGTPSAPFNGPCTKIDQGSSTQNTWYSFSNCARGESYCVEAYSIIGIKNTYDQDNCQGPVIKVEPYYGWSCK